LLQSHEKCFRVPEALAICSLYPWLDCWW